jgi:hypothetical protein
MTCCTRFAIVVLVASVLPALSARRASATVVLPADFGVMAAESQTIVHGVVIDVRSQMPGDRRSIESIVSLRVVTTFKGQEAAVVVFRVPSGRIGRYRRVTAGAPEFAAGDEVVVFLDGAAPAVPSPYGLSQGVYRVERLPDGRAVVTPLPADPGRTVRGDPARRPLSIDAFAQHVRAAVAR